MGEVMNASPFFRYMTVTESIPVFTYSLIITVLFCQEKIP